MNTNGEYIPTGEEIMRSLAVLLADQYGAVPENLVISRTSETDDKTA